MCFSIQHRVKFRSVLGIACCSSELGAKCQLQKVCKTLDSLSQVLEGTGHPRHQPVPLYAPICHIHIPLFTTFTAYICTYTTICHPYPRTMSFIRKPLRCQVSHATFYSADGREDRCKPPTPTGNCISGTRCHLFLYKNDHTSAVV